MEESLIELIVNGLCIGYYSILLKLNVHGLKMLRMKIKNEI